MKKIGIITFHNAQNFGAVMQTYALSQYLSSKENYEVYIIDYRNKKITKNYKIIRINKRNPIKSLISNIYYLPKNITRKKYYKSFMKQNYKTTKKYTNARNLKKDYPKFDVYITGSDQIWNSNITGGIDDVYFLQFGSNNIKKISYAASIGDERLIKTNQEQYQEQLKNLNHISVREETTKKKLQEYIKRDIAVVLDPTLILNEKDYFNLIKEIKENKEEYIFIGDLVPNAEYLKIADYLGKKLKLKKVGTSKNTNIEDCLINCYNKGPLQFLNYLVNSKYVITNSFHVIVFSILFKKKFWVCPPENNFARIKNLLNKLGLEDRMVFSLEDFKKKKYDTDINYDKVYELLDEERKKSMDWLIHAIEE